MLRATRAEVAKPDWGGSLARELFGCETRDEANNNSLLAAATLWRPRTLPARAVAARALAMELKWTSPYSNTVDMLRAGFLTVAGAILAANNIGLLRRRFISYGARSGQPSVSTGGKNRQKQTAETPRTALERVSDFIAGWSVPHAYFIHFYIVSVLFSLVWATQLATRGPLFRVVAATLGEGNLKYSMSPNQVLLCWLLYTIQGVRRLYECVTLIRPSSSRMWIGHWLFGLGFYMAMNMAIWVEGSGKDHKSPPVLIRFNISRDLDTLLT
ncbi:3-oxo-5-alpha-steroid 4-dehydrogenase [Ophidiomyces ophidiicola]|uniref:3-oxo-5-alpha-steroid 4-dehydrogenase n=1 Tax=Ophidiomyces ophidiicola TaxID=1387563 RepID=A0ACB8UVY0_9EURO|nr:3-oxo-5-alpha-steroid 4-dehydrogenase [Ophidiomyces ophidiicola]KAI1971852.1 3-oxo-5-alpha-steroid 4-dehydrogenase [Ophidiomyces ophidiicola]KAI2017240.1 3-oxo-5-alpha-steroid 4-dehydrogenase [Ophidiomyces ophidiicola]KAI2023752.1 3-oxo-5-alpha-steroid 4-dehydrogenase [Ophidiomyces ophidiicola]KAI2036698.1 3-oxo-5-alpha-steroid 4-dehydrogenase [Ophidiomyces ophidiicola]